MYKRRSHNLRNIVPDSSIHSTNILSSSIHSGKNVQASLNRDQNDNDITIEFNSIVIDVNSYQNQTFPATTNSVQTNHPFELDKALPPKMATPLSVLIPEYTPPDRHTRSSRIINEYHQYINDLKSVLPHVGPIAFANNIWKDVSAHHIICLSLYTFTMNFEFVSLPISFHLFHEQKLSSNIQAFFEHERDRFSLNTRILAGITIDNGPDIKSAASYNILGARFACLAHCLNVTVPRGLNLWEKPNSKKYPFDSAHHEIIDSLINDEDDELTSDFLPNISSISLGDDG
ncbi:unnamed protein product [Rotaria sordida]|uniref:Uncharacterized protein n=1 Tax=Rotaria sordida TaxID=392033 RepID=A0A814SMZ4_9BILA|nr:unnamed protein product [Rotaria sordida]